MRACVQIIQVSTLYPVDSTLRKAEEASCNANLMHCYQDWGTHAHTYLPGNELTGLTSPLLTLLVPMQEGCKRVLRTHA